MLNRKYFPFERNSYYFGKLLTAKDFEAEQRYFNDKRRFVNRLMGANGIVAGMGVVMADDSSIVLQAGCAFDASGREIVVPETKVIKLSTIDGYGQLETSCAYVGVSYREQPADEVYAAMRGEDSGGEFAFNKSQETYALTLLDEAKVAKIENPLSEFVTALVVYSDAEVVITQYTPKFVARNTDIAVRVEIAKTGHGAGEYSFYYDLDTPGFIGEDGNASVRVAVNGLHMLYGDRVYYEYAMKPEPYIWGGAGSATMIVSGLSIQNSQESFTINERLECTLRPVEKEIDEFFLDEYYEKSMDKLLLESYDEKLWIARIDLFRQQSSLIIDKVHPAPFGQRVYNSGQLMLMRELERYYPSALRPVASSAIGGTAPATRAAPQESGDTGRNTACGVFDIGLGLGYNTREPAFSEEIMHGLGKGPVYVDVGVEYITTDEAKGVDRSEIILGDVSLFAEDRNRYSDERIYNLSCAVKVLPERGTFVVGVLPKETSGLISLRIRWFAMRLSEVSKQIRTAHDGEKYILINPDTIVVAPKGTAHITPVFINMPTEACSYHMIDEEGGSIDNNGVYTAPAKEGVYEIRVASLSDPSIYAHAFAIVTQKKRTEPAGGAGGK